MRSILADLLPLVNNVLELPLLDVLIILVVSFLIGQMFSFLLARFAHLREKLESFQISQKSATNLLRATKTLATTLFAWYGIEYLLAHPLHPNIRFALLSLVILGLTWLGASLWEVFMDLVAYRAQKAPYISRQTETIILPFTRKFIRFVIFVVGFLILLSAANVNIASLVAALGIGGIALSFAAKDSVENIFGSLTIVLDMPFGVGDWVKIGSVEGTVEEINMRSTRIRTIDDSIVTLPNGNLVKTAVENSGLRRYRRLKVVLGLAKDTTPEKITDFTTAAREFLEAHPSTRKEGIFVYFFDISPTALEVLVVLHIESKDYVEELKVREEILLHILDLAQERGIVLVNAPLPS